MSYADTDDSKWAGYVNYTAGVSAKHELSQKSLYTSLLPHPSSTDISADPDTQESGSIDVLNRHVFCQTKAGEENGVAVFIPYRHLRDAINPGARRQAVCLDTCDTTTT